MTRSMLEAKDIPKMIQGEMTSTTVYMLNTCSTKKIVEKTPYEAWTGVKSNVNHLRVFGGMCFRHVTE